MNRALRAFVIAHGLTWVIYGAIFYIITHRSMTAQSVYTTELLMNLDAQTGLDLAVVAGVVAVVACLQQRRRVWAAVLVALVALVFYFNYLSYALYAIFLSFGGAAVMTLNGVESRVVFGLAPGLVLALVVLASTFWPRPAAVKD